MKSKRNKLHEKEPWKNLHGMKKIQYIWDYYKLPLVVFCIILYIISYSLYRHAVHKEPVLYTALINISPSESLSRQLSSGFMKFLKEDTSKKDFQLYTGLYLTDDETNPFHEYTYASRMKILASIDSEQLDVVLMNKEAFDAFSQNGYLCNLEDLFLKEDAALYNHLKPYLSTNTIILEDSSRDRQFDSSIAQPAVTVEQPVGLDLSKTGQICEAGLNDTVYAGIVANSPRKETAINYIEYLLSKNESVWQ